MSLRSGLRYIKIYYIIAKILVNINNILSQKGKNVNSHKKGTVTPFLKNGGCNCSYYFIRAICDIPPLPVIYTSE